jgi:hypothetical protein
MIAEKNERINGRFHCLAANQATDEEKSGEELWMMSEIGEILR